MCMIATFTRHQHSLFQHLAQSAKRKRDIIQPNIGLPDIPKINDKDHSPIVAVPTLFQQQLLCIIFACFRQRLVFAAPLIFSSQERGKKSFLAVNSAAASDPVLLGSNEFSPLPFLCPLGLGGRSVQSAGLLCAVLINNEPSGSH